jgi:hypothetical protein
MQQSTITDIQWYFPLPRWITQSGRTHNHGTNRRGKKVIAGLFSGVRSAKMASVNAASATEMASNDPAASATTEEQIEDNLSDYDDPSPNHRQKKEGNEYIKTLYSIKKVAKEDGMCTLCNRLFAWQAINATKLTQHIVQSCRNTTDEIKEKAISQTQHKKREKEARSFLSSSPDGTYTNETAKHIMQATLSKNKTTQSSAKRQKVV